MSKVFLDTVGLLAVWDMRDQWHDAETAAFALLCAEGAVFITTTFVLAECGNALARTRLRQYPVDLRRSLESDGDLINPADAEWHEAWVRYEAGHSGGPGLVDEISFAVMRRLGLKRAFTNDAHFRDAGFDALF